MSSRVGILLVVLALLLAACGGAAEEGTPAGNGGGAAAGDASNGETLFQQASIGDQNAPGCVTCHSVEPGATGVGPSLAGIAGEAETIIASQDYEGDAGSAVEYIHESIVEPDAYVAEGFQPGIMPQNYEEQLSAQQIDDLTAYLATLE